MTTEHLYDPIGDVIRDGVPRELLVDLSDSERLQIVEAKSAIELELEAHRTRAAEIRRELERRISTMATDLRARQQRRTVICYERWDNGQIEVVRRDVDPRNPASVVDRRPATIEESQRLLAVAAGAAEPAEPAGKRKRT